MRKKPEKKDFLLPFFIIALIQIILIPFIVKSSKAGSLHVAWMAGFGFHLYFLHKPCPRGYRGEKRFSRWIITALILIFLVGGFFRIYRISEIPPGLWVDELYTASNALELNSQGHWKNPFHMTPLVGKGWVETSNLYLIYIRIVWVFFGLDYVGMKMASILPGILSLGFLYLLVKRLWGFRAGLAAAFFLAISSWQAGLSRWGWDEVLLTALQIPVFIFLWRGFRKRRLFDFALGGIFLGLCQYTYASSRILAGFVFCFLVAESIFTEDFYERNKKGIFLFSFIFALLFLPLCIYFFKYPAAFSSRFKDLSIFKDMDKADSIFPLIRNLYRHFLMFHVIGDPNIRHHLSEKPLLDIVSGFFMAVGILVVIFGFHRRKNRFVLLWLLAGLLGGILSSTRESPQSYRTGITGPPAFILCGIGLMWLIRMARRFVEDTKQNRLILHSVVLALIIISLIINYHRYFVIYPEEPDLWNDFWGSRDTFMARVIKEKEYSGTKVLLDSVFLSNFYSVFQTAQRIINNGDTEYFEPFGRTPPPPEDGFLVFIPPFRRTIYEQIHPKISWETVSNPIGEVSFYYALIKPDFPSLAPQLLQKKKQLFEVVYYRNDRFIHQERKNSLKIDPIPRDATKVKISAIFILPRDHATLFMFDINTKSDVEFFMDGENILLDEKRRAYIPVSGDAHRMEIIIDKVQGNTRPKLLWRPDYEHEEPVPLEFFIP